MTTVHDLAIQKLASRRPERIQTRGLNELIDKINKKYEWGLSKEERRLRRIPDAWSYTPNESDELPGTLILFEVEDHNPMSADKLRDYADFCDMADFYDLEVKLFVYDRYCEHEREIDLNEYFWLIAANDLRAEQS